MSTFTNDQLAEMIEIQKNFEEKMESKIDQLIELEKQIDKLQNQVQCYNNDSLSYRRGGSDSDSSDD